MALFPAAVFLVAVFLVIFGIFILLAELLRKEKYLSELRNRHLAEWRFLLFTMIVTVNRPICNVIRISNTPFAGV